MEKISIVTPSSKIMLTVRPFQMRTVGQDISSAKPAETPFSPKTDQYIVKAGLRRLHGYLLNDAEMSQVSYLIAPLILFKCALPLAVYVEIGRLPQDFLLKGP